jgi:hypothetical protein
MVAADTAATAVRTLQIIVIALALMDFAREMPLVERAESAGRPNFILAPGGLAYRTRGRNGQGPERFL